jgi:tetratricopeptide (TPR) repeat protein
LLERSGHLYELSFAWVAKAASEQLELRYEEQLRCIERGLVHARRSGDTRIQAELILWAGCPLTDGPRPLADATAELERLYASVVSPWEGAEISSWLRWVRLMLSVRLHGLRGEFDLALQRNHEWIELLRELGFDDSFAFVNNDASEVELLADNPAGAERRLRPALAVLERIGEKRSLPYVAGLLARALYAQERYEEAAQFAAVYMEKARTDNRGHQIQWRAIQATMLARQGEPEPAEALAREAVCLVEATEAVILHADTLLDLAEVLRLAGRNEEAAPFMAKALALYEHKGVVPSAARARRLLATAPA